MDRHLHILDKRAAGQATQDGSKTYKSSNSSNIVSDVNLAQTSLRERLVRFSNAKKKDSNKAAEVISHDNDPTTAFFNRLKRHVPAHGDSAPRQPKRARRPYDQDTSSSPISIARDTGQHHQKQMPLAGAIEATYAGKADELERATSEKLDQARDRLKIQIEDLKQQEGHFVDELKARQQLIATPLHDLKFVYGSRKERNLGRILADFRAEKEIVEKVVSNLWEEWDNLNVQIRQLCERVVTSDDSSQDEDLDGKIQEVLEAATKELEDLGTEAKKALETAEKDAEKQRRKLRELWIEEKAREYDNAHSRKLKFR
ncbi:hypothetical protein MGG_00941 [Pyricularia oryzae 70-15]|uniref:Uncharacterized protein n=3 Tax=Pyricularia oryzae TaxID=318829 RepID=G4NDD6_PYRO7|nr:uncharacterized protein MGG_00941 [Pyricularia oryzae 70-15]EHA48425.1 hypothetical protein MGG_00941 [Pyricularia oryzae 70-15]KAI7917183.1 hypothetical protein M9X92_007505 [Pyricularia oryzae]KAI7917995.1 hypothetical protein M0657_007811 [Pyricularia oryzae]